MKRKDKRELLFRMLFGKSIYEEQTIDREHLENYHRKQKDIEEEEKTQILKEWEELTAKISEIDEIINASIDRWNTQTMEKVELSVLRLMVYEILLKREVELEISIKAAIELADSYGKEGSGKFVHGALARIIQKNRNGE